MQFVSDTINAFPLVLHGKLVVSAIASLLAIHNARNPISAHGSILLFSWNPPPRCQDACLESLQLCLLVCHALSAILSLGTLCLPGQDCQHDGPPEVTRHSSEFEAGLCIQKWILCSSCGKQWTMTHDLLISKESLTVRDFQKSHVNLLSAFSPPSTHQTLTQPTVEARLKQDWGHVGSAFVN